MHISIDFHCSTKKSDANLESFRKIHFFLALKSFSIFSSFYFLDCSHRCCVLLSIFFLFKKMRSSPKPPPPLKNNVQTPDSLAAGSPIPGASTLFQMNELDLTVYGRVMSTVDMAIDKNLRDYPEEKLQVGEIIGKKYRIERRIGNRTYEVASESKRVIMHLEHAGRHYDGPNLKVRAPSFFTFFNFYFLAPWNYLSEHPEPSQGFYCPSKAFPSNVLVQHHS